MSTETPSVSKAALWSGRVMSALGGLFLLVGSIFKFAPPAGAEQGFNHLGIAMPLSPTIGTLELVCSVLYLIPRTSVLGAILATGYLGGAILAHLRVGDSVIAQPLIGVVLWGGLWLRDPRIRALIPFRK